MGGQNAGPVRERRKTPRAELIERWLALVSAVLSLVVAILALYIAKRTDTAVSSTSDIVLKANKNTENIAESLSTRYVGQFPDILPKIVGALNEAQTEISVLTDVPGYGIYSSYDTYVDYEATLLKKAQHVAIRIVVLTPQRRRTMLNLQFGGRSLESLQREENYKRFRKWGGPTTENIRSIGDFEGILADAHDSVANEFSKTMQVRQYDGQMAVYLWLVDDKVAVLSIPNLDPAKPQETGFITNDARLIGQLCNVFHSYWSTAHSLNYVQGIDEGPSACKV